MVQGMFSECTLLEWVEFTANYAGSISLYGLDQCPALKYLFMRNSTRVVPVDNGYYSMRQSAFYGGGSGVGIAYVPRTLISSYQTATNWSIRYDNGTCVFKAIEDYTLDGTVTGEIDWSKIEMEAALNE